MEQSAEAQTSSRRRPGPITTKAEDLAIHAQRWHLLCLHPRQPPVRNAVYRRHQQCEDATRAASCRPRLPVCEAIQGISPGACRRVLFAARGDLPRKATEELAAGLEDSFD